MNELKGCCLGAMTGRRAPMEMGFPWAVVFRIRKGIGFWSLVVSSISLSSGAGLFVLNRSATKTFGARDLVVMVLQQGRELAVELLCGFLAAYAALRPHLLGIAALIAPASCRTGRRFLRPETLGGRRVGAEYGGSRQISSSIAGGASAPVANLLPGRNLRPAITPGLHYGTDYGRAPHRLKWQIRRVTVTV